MKRFYISTAIFLFVSLLCFASKPKYVFYFIGDGMGVNQVHGTEMYRGELAGRIGIEPLCFTQFPWSAMVTTYSASNGVTDSAASGTALATGSKTLNHMIGMTPDSTAVYSVAVRAKQSGAAVAIGTTVSANHATPGAFYAHQPNREMYYNIARDMIKADFDFYAGADIQLESAHAAARDSLYRAMQKAGYTLVRGYDKVAAATPDAKKMILFQRPGVSQYSIPYTIDRTDKDMTLAQITQAAIDVVKEKSDRGFFMMMEGGRIDQAGHSNDAAANFREVIDFDNAIKVAYEFYKQHPDETLIVVTADHETGGLILGNSGSYTLNLKVLQNQKVSKDAFYGVLETARKQNPSITWEEVKKVITANFGFWDKVKLTEAETQQLQTIFNKTFKEHTTPLRDAVVSLLNQKALLGWASGNHSGGYVPVFAIGAGADRFHGRIDNTDIPKIITEAAGY